jgi:ribosomal protein L21E
MTHPNRTTDRRNRIIPDHAHVKITHPKHAYAGLSGTVVRIHHPRVWVALPDGTVTGASHRSVEVIVPRGAVR